MELAKLQIEPLDNVAIQPFKVMFNPNTYSISKNITWTGATSPEINAPTLSFSGADGRTLSLELFYDVTEPVNDVLVDDVRQETNKMVELTRIQRDLHRPPVLQITWGDDSSDRFDFPFIGVVTQLTQRFTLFRADGKPVRATLTVAFKEFCDVEKDKKQTDPEFTYSPRKTWRHVDQHCRRGLRRSNALARYRRSQSARRSAPSGRWVTSGFTETRLRIDHAHS